MDRILAIRQKIKDFTTVNPSSKSSVAYREYMSRISSLQEVDILLTELENQNHSEKDLTELLDSIEKRTNELTEW